MQPALEALRVNMIVMRAKVGLSQAELAARSGVALPTIVLLERVAGDVGISAIRQIADALGTTVQGLLNFTPDDFVGSDELAARASADNGDFVDADALLQAIDESAGPAGFENI